MGTLPKQLWTTLLLGSSNSALLVKQNIRTNACTQALKTQDISGSHIKQMLYSSIDPLNDTPSPTEVK